MRRFIDAPSRGALLFAAVLAASTVLVVLAGCTGSDTPNTETLGAILSTGTVQAPTATDDTSDTVNLSTDATAAVVTSGTVTAKPSAPKLWPANVSKFAANVKSPVWFPKTVTSGYKIESADIVELDKGTGLICSIVWVGGDKAIVFTQGSPKQRSYPVESEGKVAWGTEKADIMRFDPEDPESPWVIVYNKAGNFAELQGDATLDELKAVAASMVPVK